MAKKKAKRGKRKTGKRKERKFSDFSENYQRTIMRNRRGLCHCGRPQKPGRKLCEHHLEYQRNLMRRINGAKGRHVAKEDFLTVDWSFGDDAVAAMLGCAVTVAAKWRRRLIRTGELRRDLSVKGNVRAVLSP